MKRPGFITLLAVVSLWVGIGASLHLLFFLFFAPSQAFEQLGRAWTTQAQEDPGVISVLAALGSSGALTALYVCALLQGIVGLGLWRLHNWARLVYMVYLGMFLVLSVFGAFLSIRPLNGFALGINTALVVACTAILWYLFRPHVKQAFAPK